MPEQADAEAPRASPEAARSELLAILRSQPFIRAPRSQRFLTYIVDETLAGRTDGIKESLIGLEVFDRAADFDPKLDTVVRVEAGKLRKRLDEYYSKDGASDPVRILVPKGAYVPLFQVRPDDLSAALVADEVPRPPNRFRLYAAIAAAVALSTVIAWTAWHFRDAAAPQNSSVAVLPFLNLSGSVTDDYFADGLTEELTDALCNAGGMRVVSRTSAFFFKGKQADVQEIGNRLHAAFVVEGSVRKQGQQLRVTAQLIRVKDGYHLWSGSFERQLTDVFAVQQQIADSITVTMRRRIAGGQERRVRKPHTANQQAFDLYLRGKNALNAWGKVDLKRAEQLLQESIAADPDYAPPYVALTEVYGRTGIFSDEDARELFRKSDAAIRKALALDDQTADAYAMLASMQARNGRDLGGAERSLRHALRLNPNSSQAHYHLAQNVLAPQERWAEALAENRLASELDPLSPLIAYSRPWLAVLQRDHVTAVEGFRKLAQEFPENSMAVGGLAGALMGKGDYEEALDIVRSQMPQAPRFFKLAHIGFIRGRQNNRVAAGTVLQDLQAAARNNHVPPMCFALVYLGLGDADNAFRYLEEARQQDEFSYLIYARVAYLFDSIRHDARFPKLLSEIGLGDAQIAKNEKDSELNYR